MIKIELTKNKGYRWFSNDQISVKGSAILHDKEVLTGESLLSFFESIHTEEEFISALDSLNGMFSIVIVDKEKETVWAAVDIVRCFPLLYCQTENGLIITDDFHSLPKNNIPTIIDKEAEIAMRHITWVPGKKTLIKNVFQLQAGEYLSYQSQKSLKTAFWHSIQPSITQELSREEWKKIVKQNFSDIGKRLSLFIGDRPVALPLSGGYDSRLIGLWLKLNGHKNVTCFTFGYENSLEARSSKEIAKRLGYPWMIIDYDPYIQVDFTQSSQFLEYADFAANAISFPYFQDFFAAQYLKEKTKLPENTIFIPGHSGDSIGGCSFTPDLQSFRSPQDLSAKIFRMYGQGVFPTKKSRSLLLRMIEENIDQKRLKMGSLAYEDWQIRESHTKQLVNSSNVFDYFGYEYLLPLSDRQFYDIFASLPNKYRIYKNLHEETLVELFSEHDLKLDEEVTPPQKNLKIAHLQLKLRELFPFLARLRPRRFTSSFYPYGQLLEFMRKKVSPIQYKRGNAIISAWYIDLFSIFASSKTNNNESQNR